MWLADWTPRCLAAGWVSPGRTGFPDPLIASQPSDLSWPSGLPPRVYLVLTGFSFPPSLVWFLCVCFHPVCGERKKERKKGRKNERNSSDPEAGRSRPLAPSRCAANRHRHRRRRRLETKIKRKKKLKRKWRKKRDRKLSAPIKRT